VNHVHGKNLIGAFHQPALVWIDTATLTTLPREELLCGLAEVVKHGMIRDAAYFQMVADRAEAILALDPACLREVVLGSCRIKGAVVAADEREGGIRAILNFGHTFGHAFETLSRYALRHGQAVAVGMMAACQLAQRLCGLPPSVHEALADVLTRLGLPTRLPAVDAGAALALMYGDKKTERGRLRLVLPTALGAVDVVAVQDEGAVKDALRAVTG